MECEIPNEKRIENIIKNGSPNFTTFPSPVFLVVGSRPGEPPNGRTFYSNPSYYLLDNWAAEEGSDTSRFFRRDFNHFPEMKRLSVLYCKTFDTVIFDFSVLKFLTYSRFIEYFIKLVKPDGVLILDGITNTATVPDGLRRSEYATEQQWREDVDAHLKGKFLEVITTFGFPVEVKKFSEIITENEAARTVYIPLIDKGILNPSLECIVIRKNRQGGSSIYRKKRMVSKTLKKDRKAPQISATTQPEGTIEFGRGTERYVVKKTSTNVKRWIPFHSATLFGFRPLTVKILAKHINTPLVVYERQSSSLWPSSTKDFDVKYVFTASGDAELRGKEYTNWLKNKTPAVKKNDILILKGQMKSKELGTDSTIQVAPLPGELISTNLMNTDAFVRV